jgi:hypothetical protein
MWICVEIVLRLVDYAVNLATSDGLDTLPLPAMSTIERVAFADESGTSAETACYAIGVLSFDAHREQDFLAGFERLHKRHGAVGECKWSKINNSHGQINLALDWLSLVIRSQNASFDVIVVRKKQYGLWSGRNANRERAFYVTYTQLLKHIADHTGQPTKVFIDDRSDEYPLQHEAMEVIGNRMLLQLESSGSIRSIERAKSHERPGIQVADLLTGAFAASHQRYLDPKTPINAAKRLLISRLAQLLGWDDLKYDTFPHPTVNVWHFPTEFRADPQTRDVEIAARVPYVTAEELKAARGNG